MMQAPPEIISRKDYPELDLIQWDNQADTIAGTEAFSLYERRWRYINPLDLSQKELELIQALTEVYGNGYFYPHEL